MKIAQQYMKSFKKIIIQPERPTVALTDQIYFEEWLFYEIILILFSS